jgi:hypothetical protein
MNFLKKVKNYKKPRKIDEEKNEAPPNQILRLLKHLYYSWTDYR